MRFALGLEYNGTRYAGWQKQRHQPSVQSEVELALSRIANESIQITAAGRTDAGVHATQQIIHFDTHAEREPDAWIRGVNTHLPADIRILWSQAVPESFHARFSAVSRRYLYLISSKRVQKVFLQNASYFYRHPLNLDAMQEAAALLQGEHDFAAFRSAECQSHTTQRTLHHCKLHQQDSFLVIDIQANAFLHHMVRLLVGHLICIGRGLHDPNWLKTKLAEGVRDPKVAMAPAHGLYLIQVRYPLEFGLDSQPQYPCWIKPYLE